MGYKVTLSGEGGFVQFEASAPLTESRTANYEGYNIVHLPTSLWAYRNTNGRYFSINGKLVSRNENEAEANAKYLSLIRSWVLPGFGTTGSTPPIVFLTAYNHKNVRQVPCIIFSYSWNFTDDVDYIFSSTEAMPVIGTLIIELQEAYSAVQITAGDWRMELGTGGNFSFSGAEGGPAGEVTTDVGEEGEDFAGIAASSTEGFPTVGGLLDNPFAISQIPTLAQTLNVANSPLIEAVTPQLAQIDSNQFISGSNVQQILNNSVVGLAAPAAQPTAAETDPFGRDVGLAPPTFNDII